LIRWQEIGTPPPADQPQPALSHANAFITSSSLVTHLFPHNLHLSNFFSLQVDLPGVNITNDFRSSSKVPRPIPRTQIPGKTIQTYPAEHPQQQSGFPTTAYTSRCLRMHLRYLFPLLHRPKSPWHIVALLLPTLRPDYGQQLSRKREVPAQLG
jgi:hypothetical protein